MFRLYIDEVGTDAVTHLDKDKHRYLSLSGCAMDLTHAATVLEPKMDWIKANILQHDPDSPAIFHRTDILGRKGIFEKLRENAVCARFDEAILRLLSSTNFVLITAFMDKQAMMNKENWRNKEPYFYLMEIILEKYTQFLERGKSIGDIMPESRGLAKDSLLQEAYLKVRNKGTYYVAKERMEAAVPSKHLKFRWKKDNIAGLQLCDLVAHPSHMIIREKIGHDVDLGVFTQKIRPILQDVKYDRSKAGSIWGYGMKVVS
jgi:Protein of unknown function (DUF3800)